MKSFKLLTVAALLIAAPMAWAESPLLGGGDSFREGNRIFSAELQSFSVDPTLEQSLGTVENGSIMLDLTKKEATLMLFRKSNCPQGALCIAMLPAPYIVKLPLVSQTSDQCGKYYVAQRDLRTTDGALQTLKVSDFSKSDCKAVHADTEINYETQTVGRHAVKTDSLFTAERLYERLY